MNKSLVERMAAKTVKQPEGCWLWSGYRNPKGYGKTSLNGQPLYAHRVAYEYYIGPIPPGMEIDHLCHNASCVNPAHLEAVTPRENTLRCNAPNIVAHRNGTCVNGHPRSGDNFRKRTRKEGGWECRTCVSERYRARKEKRNDLRQQ